MLEDEVLVHEQEEAHRHHVSHYIHTLDDKKNLKLLLKRRKWRLDVVWNVGLVTA